MRTRILEYEACEGSLEKQEYQSPTFFGVAYAARLFGEVESQNALAEFREKSKRPVSTV